MSIFRWVVVSTLLFVACGDDGGAPDGAMDAAPDGDGATPRDVGASDGPDADQAVDGGAAYAPVVSTTAFEPDPDPDRLDPERGIYYWSPRADDPHTLIGEWLYLGDVCDRELVWAGRGSTETSPVLDAYAASLEAHRDAGRKVIFRPRYDTPSSDALNDCGVFQAATEELTRRHVDAIARMLADYPDVIAFIEAGYLGRWGEWNTAGYTDAVAPILTNPTTRRDFLAYVIDAYQAAGLDRFVGARRPLFARELIETHPGPGARVSIYNDCFMTTDSDMGTYSNYEADNPYNFATVADARAFAEALSEDVPFGGETCPSAAPRWASCENMIGPSSEPASLHMTYLHGAWAETARETWESGGCYAEIKRRLGYRFELVSVSHPPRVEPRERARVTLRIENTGWSRMHNPRTAMLVLRGAGEPLVVAETLAGHETLTGTATGVAVRDWLPGESAELTWTFDAPPPGSYALHLFIPDPDAPERLAYAVSLATSRDGAPLWNDVTGTSDLGLTLESAP